MLWMLAIACFAAAGILFRAYAQLANVRRQTDAARTQIETQIERRRHLVSEIVRMRQERAHHGGPSLIGQEIHNLLAELKSAEEKLLFAKDYYEEVLNLYSHKKRSFPHSLVASRLRMREELPPEAEPKAWALTGSYAAFSSETE